MSYPQFGYSYSSPSQLLMSNNHNSPCCDSSRPMVTDPLTGQTVCSCQYDSWTIGYSRLGTTGAIYSASYADQAYPSISIEPAPLYGSLANSYGLKDSSSEINGWTQSATHYSYDMSAYGYGNYDLNGTRRKNATRETTSTLKAWLSEHKKNPYPTKGEKIMLAIITKMTLTQVSTWFANARRRLKKENKMTWEPKNKTSEDGDESSDSDDETLSKKQESDEIRIDRDSTREGLDDKSCDSLVSDVLHHKPLDSSPQSCAQVSSSSFASTTSIPTKPKIWSLADTATCKTPPPPPTAGPFQSSPAWVPSVGAFQVPSLQASRSFGSNLTPELHADTPPQTPPNLKVPTCHQENNVQSPLNYTSHLNVVTNTRFRPSSGEPSHSSMAQSHSSTPLYNSTDMTNTAFKPVVKRENPWT